jgi:4-amino-4-deoxy-L-arabinose transferase-like glycosyltransferase
VDRRHILGVFLLVTLAMVQFVPLQVDDADASLYRIITRHVAESGEWLPLRGVEGAFPEFYEHPPLFFWVLAGVTAAVGEGALNAFCALIGLAILALTFALGRTLVGPRAALLGVLLLGQIGRAHV